VGELLWAYELYRGRLESLRLDIPESQNATPDILDEVRWNLDWMLKMQDEDGGVWHKLTSERFGSFTMPEKDDAGSRHIIGTGHEPFKGSCATAGFAAAVPATRLMRTLLFETTTHDAPAISVATGVLAAVTAIACLLPAWRATRVNPVDVLRSE